MRAADYDDWITETASEDGAVLHGLNGDILVWNPVTKRRHKLTPMGIRVNDEALKKQLAMANQLDFLNYRYHQGIINGDYPLSIGECIGQSRTFMLLLRKVHLVNVVSLYGERYLRKYAEKETSTFLNKQILKVKITISIDRCLSYNYCNIITLQENSLLFSENGV